MSNPLAIAPQKMSALANVESARAIQEVQAALVIAKRFPRDERLSLDRILNSCSRAGLAEVSSYTYKRGNTEITGPSIRLAEAVAQHWGNIEFGFREINRTIGEDGVGVSEVEAYAWDVETNTRRPARFTVRHWRDTSKGGYALTDERDIYELTANMAQRRVRACLLAVIPGDVIDAAVNQCDATLRAKADTSPEAITKMVEAFSKFGVTKEAIVKKIGRNLDTITPAQIINLRKIHTSIKDGVSVPADHFDMEAAPVSGTTGDNPLAAPAPPVETKPEDKSAYTQEAPWDDTKKGDDKEQWLSRIEDCCAEEGITLLQFEAACKKIGAIKGATATLKNQKPNVLETLHAQFRSVIERAAQEGGAE